MLSLGPWPRVLPKPYETMFNIHKSKRLLWGVHDQKRARPRTRKEQPEDQRTKGPSNQRTRGPKDQTTRGPQGQRSLNFFSRGCKYFFPGNVIFFPGNVFFLQYHPKSDVYILVSSGINYVSTYLGGGFKYFVFSPLLGEDSHFD